MLKCLGSTVEIAGLSTEPRNGNRHHGKSQRCLCHMLVQATGWDFTSQGVSIPRPHDSELLLMLRCPDGACLHQRQVAELCMVQEQLQPSLQPHRPRRSLSILPFLPLSPCLGIDPMSKLHGSFTVLQAGSRAALSASSSTLASLSRGIHREKAAFP